jgi:hypothetical protein
MYAFLRVVPCRYTPHDEPNLRQIFKRFIFSDIIVKGNEKFGAELGVVTIIWVLIAWYYGSPRENKEQ